MNVMIKETSNYELLSMIDSETGINRAIDFINEHDGLSQFKWSDEEDAFVCSQATFEWWDAVLADNEELEDRIIALTQTYPIDEVYRIAQIASQNTPLINLASKVNAALDLAFS